jgi:molecular chaperone Hsp33
MNDYVLRFGFTGLPVRGAIADLSECWQQLSAHRSYPAPISDWLAQSMLAISMVRAGIKDSGKLGLQIRGDSALRLLNVDCNQQLHVRAAATCSETGELPATLPSIRNGLLAMMLYDEDKMLSQGMVALNDNEELPDDADVAASLQHYFAQSEQLQTRFLLHFHQQRPTGIMLQRMPGEMPADDWHRLGLMLDTLPPDEMQSTPPQALLPRLFAEDELILFDRHQPLYRCSCDRERVAAVLLQLGEGDITALLQERGEVTVDCEHCGRIYRFDRVDITQLFTAGEHAAPGSASLQ